MGLIAKLLGSTSLPKAKSAPRPIPEIEKSLALVVDQRSTAQRAVDEAMRKRSDQLLVDGSDDRIAELDAEADRLRLVVERCDAAEPTLVAELAGARSSPTGAMAWIAGRPFCAEQELSDPDALGESGIRCNGGRPQRSDRCRLRRRSRRHVSAPVHVLAVDLINQFERGLERAESMASQPRKPAPTAAPPAPRPHPKKPDDVEVEFLQPPVAVMGAADRLADRGEVKRVSPDVAARLVRHGFAKYVGKAPETAPRPENAEASK